jgi:quercetin dioxygenase-like cupin family protein
VVGDVLRFLATGAETGGRYAALESTVPPGGGQPPHVHSREEESFYVLDGEVAFTMDGERIVAGAGTFVTLPVGSLHYFRNETARPARMLIAMTPAGLEDMFIEVGTPLPPGATTAAPPTPEDIARLRAIAPRFGIEIRLPPPAGKV